MPLDKIIVETGGIPSIAALIREGPDRETSLLLLGAIGIAWILYVAVAAKEIYSGARRIQGETNCPFTTAIYQACKAYK